MPDPATDILTTRAGLEFVRDIEGCSEKVQKITHRLSEAVADDLKHATGKSPR